jgi:hypothetical protein
MKKHLALAMLTTAVLSLGAQNLVKNGDFNLYPNKLGPEFRTNGGTVVLFTEESTWNRCAKLIITRSEKKESMKLSVLHAGSADLTPTTSSPEASNANPTPPMIFQ